MWVAHQAGASSSSTISGWAYKVERFEMWERAKRRLGSASQVTQLPLQWGRKGGWGIQLQVTRSITPTVHCTPLLSLVQ